MDFFRVIRGNDPHQVIQALLGIPRLRSTAILAALPAALYGQAERAAFRVYIADLLYYQGDNKRLLTRYSDLLDGSQGAGNAPPSADEMTELAARMGITFTEE